MLLWEQKSPWPAICEPVLCKKVQRGFGKDRIAVVPALGVCDVQAHISAVNIFVTQTAYLTDTKTGGIHESDHGLLFQVRHGGNKLPGLGSGRNIGKIFIKLTHGKLCIIPCFVKDIHGKETQL